MPSNILKQQHTKSVFVSICKTNEKKKKEEIVSFFYDYGYTLSKPVWSCEPQFGNCCSRRRWRSSRSRNSRSNGLVVVVKGFLVGGIVGVELIVAGGALPLNFFFNIAAGVIDPSSGVMLHILVLTQPKYVTSFKQANMALV